MKYLLIAMLLNLQCSIAKKENRGCQLSDATERLAVNVDLNNLKEYSTLQNQIVSIEGTLRFEFENVAIYLDEKESKPMKAFWIELSESLSKQVEFVRSLNGKKVKAFGKLNMENKGHMNMFEATLDSLFCIRQSK